MPVTPNIIKAVYRNNLLWADVDTSSINGTLRSWGPAPSMIDFNLNRHFDTHKFRDGPQAASTVEHFDNIKLCICSERDFYDAAKFNGAWPENYSDAKGDILAGATGNWHNKLAGSMDDYLRWQGVYVDPMVGFALNDESNRHSESFDVTCYDYRWCLKRTLFRVGPFTNRQWTSGTNAWAENTASASNGTMGYELMFNEYIPEAGQNKNEKNWVEIVEFMLRMAGTNKRGAGQNDYGMINSHIPEYDGFNVEIAWRGMRTEDGAPASEKKYFDPYTEDYPPHGSPAYWEFPEIDSPDTFIPDAFAVSDNFLLNVVQQALDATGNYQMYMDQYNCVQFVKILSPDKIDTVPDSFTDSLYADETYIVRFTDDTGEVTAASNFRGVTLRPRTVPEANRVVGILTGRDAVAHDIVNETGTSRYLGDSGDISADLHAYMWKDSWDNSKTKPDRNDHVQRYCHHTNRIHNAVGYIKKAVSITPYLYSINDLVSGATEPNGTLLTWSSSLPVQSIRPAILPRREKRVWRYKIKEVITPVSVSIGNHKGDANYDPGVPSGNGYVVLNGDAYLICTLGYGMRIYIPFIWSVRCNASDHRTRYSTPQKETDGDAIETGFGIAPASEIFTIDSTDMDTSEWDGFREHEADLDKAFPGRGEFTHGVIDARPVRRSVDDLTPSDTADDETNWDTRWNNAKEALKIIVKRTAMLKRELPTEGTQPVLYDPDLRLEHRVILRGTRDDQEADQAWWLRLNTMKARINEIRLNTNDELELTLTTELMLPEFSLIAWGNQL